MFATSCSKRTWSKIRWPIGFTGFKELPNSVDGAGQTMFLGDIINSQTRVSFLLSQCIQHVIVRSRGGGGGVELPSFAASRSQPVSRHPENRGTH